MFRNFRWAAVVAGALVLAACNNSGSGNSGGSTPPPTSTTYTIGGTVSGVTGSGLVLSNNGTTLPVGSGASTFTFTGGIATGTSYNVIVQSAPAGLLCSVASGSGTIGTSNVTNIAVTCTAQNHSVGGTISGLGANGLVLANNGSSVTVNSGATQFTFPTPIATGTPYAVTVQTAPAGYTCSVANGSGTMGTADISNVVVTCSTQSFSVGGTISGYTSTGLVLANGSDRIALATNATRFTMPTPVASTASYAVTVAVQPTGMSCSVANGSGTVGNAVVSNIVVTCTDKSYTLGGTVSGLTASGLVLANGTDTVTVAANATGFTFPTSVAFGASFAVTVSTQPMGLTCSVSGGTGTMPANNVNNVAVACSPLTYTLGGTVSGLTVAGLVLANGTDTVTVASGATSFVFPTALAAATPYSVSVSTQPNGWTCTVSGGAGNMPTNNVANVQVTCAINSYTLGGSVSGLTAVGLVLTDGTDNQSVAPNAASFTMHTSLAFGSTYAVTVKSQPVGMKCTITNGTGTMPAGNVSTVQVACTQRMWVWEAGSKLVGGTAPNARDSQTTWTDSSGNFWMFGGAGADNSGNPGDLNDVWELDPVHQAWTLIAGSSATVNVASVYTGSGAAPGGRIKSMAWVDSSGNVWLFGGIQPDGTGTNTVPLNELWKFNMSSHGWTYVGSLTSSYGPPNTYLNTNWPPARAAAVTWTDSAGKFWMFGGTGVNSSSLPAEYNDLWAFDPTVGQWAWEGGAQITGFAGTYPSTPGTTVMGATPGARYGAVAWTDSTGHFWLFGGGVHDNPSNPTFNDAYNDLWVYDPTAATWTWMGGANTVDAVGSYGTQGVPASANAPGARAGGVAWTDSSGNLWMFGGLGFGNSSTPVDFLSDLWMYNPTTQQWAWVNGSNTANEVAGNYGALGVAATANQPGSRVAAGGWVDASGNLWLFGGSGVDSAAAAGDLSDLWMY